MTAMIAIRKSSGSDLNLINRFCAIPVNTWLCTKIEKAGVYT
jgi:hypothetical protein